MSDDFLKKEICWIDMDQPFSWRSKNLTIIKDGYFVESGLRIHVVEENFEPKIVDKAYVLGQNYMKSLGMV